MTILTASGIEKSYGIQSVLRDVRFSVEEGDKIGILGVNGAGKTTLFKLICGEEEPDQGQVQKSRNLQIAYMEQYAEYTSEKTVLQEATQVFSHLMEQERQLDHLQEQLAEQPSEELARRFHDANERFIDAGGLTYKSRVHSTLIGLGFLEEELHLPMDAVSGGQRTRVLLARLLLGQADILLLDEPTNHLDMQAIAWLEDFLANYRGTVLVISHDRYFLDRITNRIFEVENGKLTAYKGNYSAYVRQKEEIRAAKAKEYEIKTKEIHRLEGIIEKQKQWNREKNLVTARSKQKVIDRIAATLDAPEKEPENIHFHFSPAKPSGNDVLSARDVSVAFEGIPLFQNVNLDIKRGEKAFLLGDNGCGKTTLFRAVLGQQAAAGEIRLGSNVKVGYYDQAQSDLSPDKTVLETLSDALPQLDLGILRNALAAFLFRGDDVEKKIASLSGGEKARVTLARLMLSDANFLLLDEPTNHLDIASKEALEKALLEYDGTLFIISHDRYFINALATQIYRLTADGTEKFGGDYQYFLEKSLPLRREETPEKEQKPNAYQIKKEQASRVRRLQGQISRLEKEIEAQEAAMAALQEKLSLPEIAADYEKIGEISAELEELQEKTAGLYAKWEECSEELAEQGDIVL